MSVRATYALDIDTVERLEALARLWSVSKSEALRRAIRAAGPESAGPNRVDALKRLQKSAGLTRQAADKWVTQVRAERQQRTKQFRTRA